MTPPLKPPADKPAQAPPAPEGAGQEETARRATELPPDHPCARKPASCGICGDVCVRHTS